jgi:NitT/TauT family transport system substrate-binding protein
VTRRPLLASRRDELLRMTRAMARVLRWIAATPGDEIALAVAEFFPDVPHGIFAAAMDRYRALGLYAVDPVLRREGFERLQAAMRSGGALDRAVPFEVCVDNSLAEAALG